MLFMMVHALCRQWVLRTFSPLLSGKWAEKPQQTNFSLLKKKYGGEEEFEVETYMEGEMLMKGSGPGGQRM